MHIDCPNHNHRHTLLAAVVHRRAFNQPRASHDRMHHKPDVSHLHVRQQHSPLLDSTVFPFAHLQLSANRSLGPAKDPIALANTVQQLRKPH